MGIRTHDQYDDQQGLPKSLRKQINSETRKLASKMKASDQLKYKGSEKAR